MSDKHVVVPKPEPPTSEDWGLPGGGNDPTWFVVFVDKDGLPAKRLPAPSVLRRVRGYAFDDYEAMANFIAIFADSNEGRPKALIFEVKETMGDPEGSANPQEGAPVSPRTLWSLIRAGGSRID